MLGGLALVAGVALGELVSPEFFYLAGLMNLFLLVGLPGLHACQGGRDGRLGRAGFLLAWVGTGGWVLVVAVSLVGATFFAQVICLEGPPRACYETPPDLGPIVRAAALLALLGMLVGVALFAVATARAKVLPAGAAILFALGLVTVTVISAVLGLSPGGQGETPISVYIGVLALAGGLIWLGHVLWSGGELSL